MKLQSALAIYLLFWTLTLFAVLPFGVRTPDEDGSETVAGQASSAPSNPMIAKKLAWTSLISGVLFGLFMANYTFGWIGVDDVPFWRTRLLENILLQECPSCWRRPASTLPSETIHKPLAPPWMLARASMTAPRM